VLLSVLAKAQAKVPQRLYAVSITGTWSSDLMMPPSYPVLCIGLVGIQQWHSTVLLGVAGTSGRQAITPQRLAPKEHRRVMNTLRHIHANPKSAGVRKGFYDPYSNYEYYGRLECDGISEWHPSFLQLAPTLK
jgi:hypothetical protein